IQAVETWRLTVLAAQVIQACCMLAAQITLAAEPQRARAAAEPAHTTPALQQTFHDHHDPSGPGFASVSQELHQLSERRYNHHDTASCVRRSVPIRLWSWTWPSTLPFSRP